MIQNNHLLQAAIGYPAAGFAKDAIRWLILAVRLWIKRKVFITTTLQESYAATALGWLRERPEMQSLSERVALAAWVSIAREETECRSRRLGFDRAYVRASSSRRGGGDGGGVLRGGGGRAAYPRS